MNRPAPDPAFVPRCPACGYDLSGTPGERCPECGGLFKRSEVWNPAPWRDDWPENYLLIGAIFISMMGFGPPESLAVWIQLTVAWCLAFGWVYTRRRTFLERNPWLALWLLPVAMGTSGIVEDATISGVALCFVGAVAALAVAFGVSRAPRQGVSLILLTVAGLLLCLGVWLGLMFALSGLDIAGRRNTQVFGLRIPAGRWPDALGCLAALLTVGLGVLLWRLAGSLRGRNP